MISGPLLTFLVIGLYGFLHSLLASLWAKEKAENWFEPLWQAGIPSGIMF